MKDFLICIDNTPIEAGCPDDITTNAIVDSYSTVDFTVNCTDSVDTYIVPKCNATKNETLFPVGSTTVTCLCQDQSENVDNCSFSVTVNGKSVTKLRVSEVVVILRQLKNNLNIYNP